MKQILFTAIILAMSTSLHAKNTSPYPDAPRDNTVDEYFGMKVNDPYRPLENDTARATLDWVIAENAVTNYYLRQIPFREKIRTRLTELNDYHKSGLPHREPDGRFYYYENDGLKNQSLLYRKDTLDGTPELFLDPNKLSTDGTVALTGTSMSPDGRYTAYTISRSGSDWTEIYVMETDSKRLLNDHIEWAKFTSAAWDGDGFYYSAYPRPEAGKEFSNANEYHNVYYHKIGTPQSEDILVYEDRNNPLHFHHAWVPESQDYIVVDGSGEGLGNSLMIKSLKKPNADWIVMESTQDYPHDIVDIRDGKIYILTAWGAPKYRLMVADPAKPQRENWKELVPEGKGVLNSVDFTKDKMILTYEEDAGTHLYIHNPRNGKRIKEIELPTFGTAAVTTNAKHDDVFYAFVSFTYPSSGFAYDMKTGKSTQLYKPTLKNVNLDDYVTEQVFYPSTDGTKIPMYITYKKGTKRDGKNPVYLYGYGGFNISMTPSFSTARLLWLENGGVYAQANLRGGGEYGEEWHEAGTKQNKLNVFNDFISAGEYLIDQGWTTSDNLVIEGGSNGGLLVGACVNMRPDLFKVAIPRVGVMDMMRYHLFTIGWNWASDYGTSADSPEMAKYLLDYSPIHNIKNDGTPYPAILVTTADHDDRVVPAHSFKYAATLQAADTGNAPKLIRIESKAGHGSGKPISKVIDEATDMYSFIFYNLGREPK